MALVVISIDRSELPDHSDEEFEEWVRYQVGDTPHMEIANPLSSEDMQATVREVSR